MKAAFKYVKEHCIGKRGEKSKAVHNMAFFFLSKINDSEKIVQLLESSDLSKEGPEIINFLEKEEANKSKGLPIYFEVDYALNICKQKQIQLID